MKWQKRSSPLHYTKCRTQGHNNITETHRNLGTTGSKAHAHSDQDLNLLVLRQEPQKYTQIVMTLSTVNTN